MKNGRRKLSRTATRRVTLSIVLVVLTLAALVAVIVISNRARTSDTPQSTPAESTSTAPLPEKEELTFPMQLENGALELVALFRYDGANPDASLASGQNVAALEVKNTSGLYITKAHVEVELVGSKKIAFEISELPNEKSVLVFSSVNAELAADEFCTEAVATISFGGAENAVDERISVTVSGNVVTLQNLGATPLENISVYCHDVLEERYFGGVSHKYKVNTLPAYGTFSLTAEDTVFGDVAVVRVTVGEEDKGVQE